MAEGVQTQVPWQTQIKSLKAGISYIYRTKQLADIVLVVAGRKFKAHRLILSTRSPKLAEMMLKTDSSLLKELDLTAEGVSEDGMEKLLHYIYTDELLDTDDILETYKAAKLFQQKGLLKKCQEIIEKTEINYSNVCSLLKDSLDIDVLKTCCLDYIKSNDAIKLNVVNSEDFINLADENLRELLEEGYFKNVPSLVLLKNVLRWAQNQFAPQNDYKLVRELLLQGDKPILGLLGIENLDSAGIAEIVSDYKELLTAEESMQFVVYSHNRRNSGLPNWCVHQNNN